MTKEKFIKYVNVILEIYNKSIKIDTMLERELGCRTDIMTSSSNIDIIIRMFKDWYVGDDDDWLEWYVYESDGGTKECHAFIYDNVYRIKTPEDLWNYMQLNNSKE